jgi:hypothetical protein|tara:strand:- start:580 stop:885 length:306 start_codon:yes stop_codon:yes gene_type:complete
MTDELAFVVASAAPKQGIIANRGLEWWSYPGFQGLHWLYIVVPIEQHSRTVVWGRDLREERGRPWTFPDLNAKASVFAEFGGYSGGGPASFSVASDTGYLD